MSNPTAALENATYDSRESRNQFIANHLGDYIGRSVLNVGGGGKLYLAQYLPDNIEYVEMDVSGEPHYKLNLEQDLPLPIEDRAFETVICTEVLEHVDNFHDVFSELLRVSSKWLIISLPNCLNGIDAYFLNSKRYQTKKAGITRGSHLKFYGLPAFPPDDRHKWFFSYSEAEAFFRYHESPERYRIVTTFPTGLVTTSRRENLKRRLLRTFLSRDSFYNLYSASFWCVLDVSRGEAGTR